MKYLEPWKIWPMDFEKYIRTNFLKEVSSVMVYEPSSTTYHPEGLYSENIFGQIGTPERIGTLAYINLNCKILAPLIYVNLIKVSPWYKDIMESKVHVIYDPELGDFVVADKDNLEANTGYQYFIDHISQIVLKENTSRSRSNRIAMIYKARDAGNLFTNKMIVSPAGWRDVKTDSSGRDEVDEVNKLYTSLIIASKEINTSNISPLLISMYDKVKNHIQLKAVEIFTYWKTFYEGKTGFGREHYAKRSLADGTRNVITTSPLMCKSPDDPAYLKHNDTQVPLYQSAKAFIPIVTYGLNMLFHSTVFTEGSTSVLAVDPETFNTKYIEVDPSVVTYALSSQSKRDFIDAFTDLEMRQQPVTITDVTGKEYYLWMVYDLGDEVYLFRGLDDLKKTLGQSTSNVQPTMSNVQHLQSINDLGIDPTIAVIGGSGSAIAYGLNKVNGDLDISLPDDVITDLIEKGKLVPAPKDGIHDHMFTSLDGKVDVAYSKDTHLTNGTYDYFIKNSHVVDGYRILTWHALVEFYTDLYNKFKKEKHKEILDWMKNTDRNIDVDPDQHYPDIKKIRSHESIVTATTTATQYLKDRKGWDVSYLTVTMDGFCYDEDDKEIEDQDKLCPGSWTKHKKIYVKMPGQLRKIMDELQIGGSVDDFILHMIVHECGHEIWHNVLTPSERESIIDTVPSDFTSPYLKTFSPSDPDYDIEKFCEYLAVEFDNSGYTKVGTESLNVQDITVSKIRPLTNVEMLYIATFGATRDKFVNITRFPATEKGSIYPSNNVVMSTVPDRVVTMRSQYSEDANIVLPHYPVLGTDQYQDSVIIHGGRTPGLTADFDGDKVSVNSIMTTEAIKEARDHIHSPSNYINSSGKVDMTIDTMVVSYVVHALTRTTREFPEVEV